MIHDKDWFIHCPIYYSHFHILNSYTAVKIILTTLNVSPLTLRNGPVLFVLLSSRYFFSWQPLLRLCPFWNHEKLPRPPKKSNIFFLKKIALRAFNIHYMFFLFALKMCCPKKPIDWGNVYVNYLCRFPPLPPHSWNASRSQNNPLFMASSYNEWLPCVVHWWFVRITTRLSWF